MSIPVFRPSIRRKEMDSVLSCMVSDHIGPGMYSEQLQELLNQYCGTKSAFLLREYERAVEICFKALNLEAGKEVVLSPLVPDTYLHVIKKLDLKPVFVDVNVTTAVPDLDDFLDKSNENTAAIVIMGVFGYHWDFSEWENPGVVLIEDITQNYGSSVSDIPAGSTGDLVLMRMEPQDLLTTGGGSSLMARNKELSDAVTLEIELLDDTVLLSDMNAALGFSMMKEFDKNFELRDELHQLFLSALRKGKHGTLVNNSDEKIIHASFPVLVKGNRQEIQKYAQKKNVETTLAFRGCCLEEELGDMIVCPVAETLILNCILFPLYPSLGKTNSETISRILATLP
ncbi:MULTISPECIES: DegT/DnrJ/EryC1/StrS family aminotransferase [unclassified Oceanispirochaeta]|uniref:DegT/DnrJ/EryC1/StrS family aminotransferase n=1 Tax=unclassified Oceanispirochaeta TaxID=2635722 RepID=UPI000E08DED5|nr:MULTISPECIES: DegT/DnrJ/EryC1/StrS family aminotransferase [unclassified Oceanispirochaeta]NPD72583.1 DegT/DnrJ/EryC1/StrS aminotransferase family protein [Oceanispirochaeta sp. M1]RDG31735.1 DegT/DnrJ/EryC1/StrS aminotransferase family protein [Oceanispirochaeta sp. M1]